MCFYEVRVMKKSFVQLILGGVRSGKTKFAKECAEQKGEEWRTVDFPTDLKQFFAGETGIKVFIVDGLTQFVRESLHRGERPKDILTQADETLEELANHDSAFIFVSNETALAFRDDDEELKTFMETLGEMNQRVAAASDEIYYMLAGVPTVVKKEIEMPASRLSYLTQNAAELMGMEGGLHSMEGLLDMGVEDSFAKDEKDNME